MARGTRTRAGVRLARFDIDEGITVEDLATRYLSTETFPTSLSCNLAAIVNTLNPQSMDLVETIDSEANTLSGRIKQKNLQ